MKSRLIHALFAAGMMLASGIPDSQAIVLPPGGLRLWLKADAITNLVDGNSVSNWSDASGNGYSLGNTGALCATWRTGVLNGKPVIRFDGVDDYLLSTPFSLGANDLTAFVVVRTNGNFGGSYGNILLGGKASYTDTTGTGFYQIFTDASALKGNFGGTTLDIVDSGVKLTGGQFQLISLHKDNSGAGSSALFLDGIQKGTTGSGVLALSTRLYLGSWYNNDMNGDIAEIILYNTVLSPTDRQLVEGLTAWKYGLQANLPSDHAWKNTDPAPLPVIANERPPFISETNATLKGYLSTTGFSAVTVSVYWGPLDGGAPTSGLWSYTNTFAPGLWGDGSYPSTNVSLPVAGLAYYYRFHATNSAGESVAPQSQVLYATNQITWIQTAAGTHYWTNSANWSPSFVPDSAGLRVVITNDYAVDQTINVDQTITLGELAFGSPTNAIIIAKLTGGAFRFDNDAESGRIESVGANGTLSVDVTYGSSTQLDVQVLSASLALGGVLGGFGHLVKSGAGILSLTGANTFTGDLIVKEGSITTSSASGVVPDASVVQVENGGVFRMGRTDRIKGARGTGYVTHINGAGNGYLSLGTSSVPVSGYTYLVEGGFMAPGIGTNIGALYTGSTGGGDPTAILGGDLYIDVAGTSSCDRLVFVRASSQSLILGGNLHLNFIEPYRPQVGHYWDIIGIQTSGTIADTNGGALFTSIDSSVGGAEFTADIVTSNKVRVTLLSKRTGTLMVLR